MILVVLLALFAHVGYTLNDISGALGARKFDGKLMSLMSWVTCSAMYLLLLPFLWRGSLLLKPTLVSIFSGVLAGVAYPLFLNAMKKGNPTLVGVVAGTFPLWIVILSVIFYKEVLTGAQIVVIACIILGIILSALHLTRQTRLHTMLNKYTLHALLVSIMWGLAFAVLKYPAETIGWFKVSIVTSYAGSALSIIWLYPKLKGTVLSSFKKYYRYPVVNALTGVSATLAYNFALTRGNSSLVAPIAGSYSGLFAILSYVAFKEKLTRLQILGVIIIFGGVVVLSVLVANS